MVDDIENLKVEKDSKNKSERVHEIRCFTFYSVEDFLYNRDGSFSHYYAKRELKDYEKDGLIKVIDGDNFSFYLYSDFNKIEDDSFLVLFDNIGFVFFALFKNGRLDLMNRYIFKAMKIAFEEKFDESHSSKRRSEELGEEEAYVFKDIDSVLKNAKAYYCVRFLDFNWNKMDNEKYFIGEDKIFALRYAIENDRPIFDGTLFDEMNRAGFDMIMEFEKELN